MDEEEEREVEVTEQRTPRGQKVITQALLKKPHCDKAKGPPKTAVYKALNEDKIPRSTFKTFYDRGDIPISYQSVAAVASRRLTWQRDIVTLDYHHYLPIFFDGVRETKEPYKTIAKQGCEDLLRAGGSNILPVVPQLIIPIKTALNTHIPAVVSTTLLLLQQLATSADHVGVALVPYYRQLLPALNMFKNRNQNIGDNIEYGQRRQQNLGDLVQQTLEVLERTGGEDSFINIKYMVPTYESCLQG